MSEKIYGTHAIARMCRVHPATIYRFIVKGKLKTFRTPGGQFRVTESNLQKFLKTIHLKPYRNRDSVQFLKILIIEDDGAVRRLVRRLIQKEFPRAEIHEAKEGYEGGFKVRDLNPKLVILDLRLPHKHGAFVCRMIKKNPALKGTKVLAMTAYEIQRSKRILLKAGADAFLPKPFQNGELAQLLKKLLHIK